MSENVRSAIRPWPIGGLGGSYRLGMKSGILAAGLSADVELFQFRFAPTTDLKAVIRKVELSAAVTTTYFAAGVPLELALFKATAWSAAGSGGTRCGALAAMGKSKTGHASSAVLTDDIGIGSTEGLTAGTKTLETVAMSRIGSGAPITASLSGQIFPPNTTLIDPLDDWPLVLGAQEGFVITLPLVPGTGTWKLQVNVAWTEVPAFP